MKLNKKLINKRHKDRVDEYRQQFYEKVGKVCFICSSDKVLCCHKKDYEKHIEIANLNSFIRLKKENSEDYVRLCFRCHFGIHWVKEYLNFEWDEFRLHFENS